MSHSPRARPRVCRHPCYGGHVLEVEGGWQQAVLSAWTSYPWSEDFLASTFFLHVAADSAKSLSLMLAMETSMQTDEVMDPEAVRLEDMSCKNIMNTTTSKS